VKNKKQKKSKSKNRFGGPNHVRSVWTCPVCNRKIKNDTYKVQRHKNQHAHEDLA
jgi:ribosomal protein L37AE/L43A